MSPRDYNIFQHLIATVKTLNYRNITSSIPWNKMLTVHKGRNGRLGFRKIVTEETIKRSRLMTWSQPWFKQIRVATVGVYRQEGRVHGRFCTQILKPKLSFKSLAAFQEIQNFFIKSWIFFHSYSDIGCIYNMISGHRQYKSAVCILCTNRNKCTKKTLTRFVHNG